MKMCIGNNMSATVCFQNHYNNDKDEENSKKLIQLK